MQITTKAGTLLAGAVLAAVALAGCGSAESTPQPSEAVTAAPTVERGEDAYLAAAENRLDIAIDTEGSFEQYPEMRQAALDVSTKTCALLAEGKTEADIFATLDSADESVLDVMRYWITAASVYVC
ncbi:hypothetical protein SEA_ANTUNA_53 [Microbacterium phage Antuna]|nr:hypothetical protein SEA_BLETT_51 [Microbacterium phage Blett]URM87315.1 hypothetical protein SEA_ANTUNA_53 [Microbacterium phage Antuna]